MTQDGRDRNYLQSGGRTWVPMSGYGNSNPMGEGEFSFNQWGSTDPYRQAVGAGYTGPNDPGMIAAWARQNGLSEMGSIDGQTGSTGYFKDGQVLPNSIMSGEVGDSDFLRNSAALIAAAYGGNMLGAGAAGSAGAAGATGIDAAALGLDGAMGAGGGFGAAGGAGLPGWAAAAGNGSGLANGAGLASEGWAAGNTAPGLYGGAGAGAAGAAGGGAGGASNFWTSLGLPAGTGGFVGAALPLVGTALQLGAAGRARGDLQASTDSANNLQRDMFNTIRQDNMPALNARNSAIGQIDALLKNPGSITSQPGYAFGLEQGQKTLNNGAASRGMTYSGQQGKALTQYGQDYAGTKLNDSINRLSELAGRGQPGATQIAGAGTTYANQVGNNTTAQGSANGLMQLGMGNALANAANGLSAYGTRQKWWGEPG